MSGILTTYLANQLLADVFNGATHYCNFHIYLALSTTSINKDGSGITEPIGNDYSRILIDFNPASYDNRNITNAKGLKFPVATGKWGTITQWALFDFATDGNMLAFGSFEEPIGMNRNYLLDIPVNSIGIEIQSESATNYLVELLLNKAFLYTHHIGIVHQWTKYIGLIKSDIEVDGIENLSEENDNKIITEDNLILSLDNEGYERIAVDGGWIVSDNQVSTSIIFPYPYLQWANVTKCFISDSITDGNILAYGVVAPFTAEINDSVQPNITIILN
jgi:hypothetical protein